MQLPVSDTYEVSAAQRQPPLGRSGQHAEPATWWLEECVDPRAKGTAAPVTTFPFRVGRHEDMSLTLPCRTVSGRHAEITENGDTLLIRDLNSTNGTFVNGRKILETVQLKDGDLLQFGRIAVRLTRSVAEQLRHTAIEDVCDHAFALTQFEKLMSQRAVVPHFQPITNVSGKTAIAFEVLGRSRLYGLQRPREMFDVASQLNMEVDLSRMMRDMGVEFGNAIYDQPHLFLNTHPSELADTCALILSLESLRKSNSDQQITLEIHEAAVTDPHLMSNLHAALRDLEIGLAYDDFGAGQARLLEIVEVSPDYLKFDMSLVQGIHKAPTQRQFLLKRLVDMVRELGITPLAEGIECSEDRDVCDEIGFELFQGFLFGKPTTSNTFVF